MNKITKTPQEFIIFILQGPYWDKMYFLEVTELFRGNKMQKLIDKLIDYIKVCDYKNYTEAWQIKHVFGNKIPKTSQEIVS